MSDRKIIQDELNELNSGLNAGPVDNPYSVPEGYFEGLASSVLAKIKGEVPVSAAEEIAQLSPLLAGISRQLPYSVPDDYFQSNLEGLMAFAIEDEESLVLSFISKEMPYEVPTGYFANVPEQVLEKVSARQAKVVHLGGRKWMRFAAAAVVTGIMAVSGFFYFNNRGGSRPTGDPVVAVKKASIQELDDFIKTTSVNDDKAQVTAKNTAPKTDRKKIFADVSDKELNAFLDQMPSDDVLDIN
ncbi:MAG: hypothetical protein ACXVLT_13295 [Flavisolibacter sp.]